MIALSPSAASGECEQMLALLSRYEAHACARDVLRDAAEIRKLLSLYSFRSPQRADRLADDLSSRYRREIVALYGSAGASRRQSDSSYLRLEQLLSLLIRVAAMRLSREGTLSLSHAQLTQSDGLLLQLLQNAAQKETGRG